ncbi:MAG: hypothetical protein QM740_22040 [Acidovorax sp.]
MPTPSDSWFTSILTVLGAFGGWAAVVAVLVHYLADLHAKRTLQREASNLNQRVADLAHELKLRESAYTKHLELLVKYYESFYRHYRICQNATNQDAFKFPDGSIQNTKDIFWENLDVYRSELGALEGSARLLLPASLLEIHDESISAFNQFKNAMKRDTYDDKYHEDKRKAFARIESIKSCMETGLRNFLRTEQMLNPGKG